MTVPAGPASLNDINSNFGGGYSLGGYYNTRWYRDNNSRGYLQASGPISISDFLNKRNTSPVSPSPAGGVIYNSSQNITLPMFNNLTITAVSGQGGQGGINGDCANGGPGGNGGSSSLSGYVVSNVGPGGSPGGVWGSQSSASTSLSINDSNQNDIISRYGTAPYGAIGGGGGGGATGYNNRSVTVCYAGYYNGVTFICTGAYAYNVCDSAVGGGGGGAGGYIRLDWS